VGCFQTGESRVFAVRRPWFSLRSAHRLTSLHSSCLPDYIAFHDQTDHNMKHPRSDILTHRLRVLPQSVQAKAGTITRMHRSSENSCLRLHYARTLHDMACTLILTISIDAYYLCADCLQYAGASPSQNFTVLHGLL
jgi:hypothetical protein